MGYCGVTSDLELVMHFLENAAALEKILVDPREPWNTPYGHMWKYNGEFKCKFIKDEAVARNRAKKQLTKKVPPRINLICWDLESVLKQMYANLLFVLFLW